MLLAALLVPLSMAGQALAGTAQAQAGTVGRARAAAVQSGAVRLAVTASVLPAAVIGEPYSFQFRASGAQGPLFWYPIGSLPPGLALNPSTGVLSGVPAVAGSQEVLVEAWQSGPHMTVASGRAFLTVEQPAITTVALVNGARAGASPMVRVWGSGFGAPPAGGTACAGAGRGLAVLDLSTGECVEATVTSWNDDEIVASLRPGARQVAGGDRLAITVNGARWTGQPATTTAGHARILAVPGTALTASAGIPFKLALPAVAGSARLSWAVTAGTLPEGLTLDPSTGVISGIPAAFGTSMVTVRAAGAGGSASTRLSLAVSANVTVPESTVASGLYQAIYFQKVNNPASPSPELETLLLTEVATRVYATDPRASATAVNAGLAALATALNSATNPLVKQGTGKGLASFGPNLVPQVAGATGVMTSFASSGSAGIVGPATEAVASSLYDSYLKTNLAATAATGFKGGYAGFNDRSLYDSGDQLASAFHALVSAPAISQAVACGRASAACASVVNSLLSHVTGVSVAATPAAMSKSDSVLAGMLSGLGFSINSNGSLTTSAAAFNNALTQAGDKTNSVVKAAGTDASNLINMAGDPASPTDPAALAKQAATDLSKTAPGLNNALSAGSFLSGIGNAVDPSQDDSSDTTLLSGTSIAQGAGQLLKALGSDNATQNTEIVDVIAGFVDICTGNIGGAIQSVFGILGAGGSSNTTQQLAKQTDTMIENVYKALTKQLNAIQGSLNALQATLKHMYSTMIADFAGITWGINAINNQLAEQEVQLNQLQYSIDITDQNILAIFSQQIQSVITGTINTCLDKVARNQAPLTFDEYGQCESNFLTEAETDDNSPAVEPEPGSAAVSPAPSAAGNGLIEQTLSANGTDPSKDLYYLLEILSTWYPHDVPAGPPSSMVNPDVWSEVALAYRELLDEYPRYSAGSEPDLPTIESGGQQVAQAISALQKVNTKSKDAPVVMDVGGNYLNMLNQLVSDLNSRQANFPTTTWDGYSPTGGITQTPKAVPDGVSGIASCGTTGPALLSFPATVPWEAGANLPPAFALLYWLVGYSDTSLKPTQWPVCESGFSESKPVLHCNPRTGICTETLTESGSLSVQFEGTDKQLNTLETVSLNPESITCVLPAAICGTPAQYLQDQIGEAGTLVQLLTNHGGPTAVLQLTVLDSEATGIIQAEQHAAYLWDLAGFSTTPLSTDMADLDGAFELFQLTAQTVAPSASAGNQALSDILYGNDELPASQTSANTPLSILQTLSATGTATTAAWQQLQIHNLQLAENLLNGYLVSANAAQTSESPATGNLPTAEAPDLVFSVLAQLNSGLLLDFDSVVVASPGSQTTTVGKSVKLRLSATSRAGAPITHWSATGLPPGLKIGSTGVITGTPTKAGSYKVTVTAADTVGDRTGATGHVTFTWTVRA